MALAALLAVMFLLLQLAACYCRKTKAVRGGGVTQPSSSPQASATTGTGSQQQRARKGIYLTSQVVHNSSGGS